MTTSVGGRRTGTDPSHLTTASPATPAPAEIVLGVYLRALRHTREQTLSDMARYAAVSVSALSRIERGENPLSPRTLHALLQYYGVGARDIQYLSRHLPLTAHGSQHYTPQERRRAYGEDAPSNVARRGRWDKWVDVAGDDATARYAAMTRAASMIVQYAAARIPPGYRTAAYRAAITSPGLCPDPDEPAEPPAWLAHVPRSPEQRRTLLLDDTVLYRPVGGPATMAEQFDHLLHLMEGTTGAGPVDIRVLPHDGPPGAFQLAGGEVGMVTVYDKQMIIGMHITPWYETRSGYARALTESLLQAVAETADRQHSYDLISQAADRWRRAA